MGIGALAIGGCLSMRSPISLVRSAIRTETPVRETVAIVGGLGADVAVHLGIARMTVGVITLGAFGLPPMTRVAAESGALSVRSPGATTMIRMLQAGAGGACFEPRYRPRAAFGFGPDFADHAGVRTPDIAYLHVPFADPDSGYAWGYGPSTDLLLAAAARRVVVSYDSACTRPPRLPNLFVLPPNLIGELVHRPFGAFPTASWPLYGPSAPAYERYVRDRGGYSPGDMREIVRAAEDRSFVVQLTAEPDLSVLFGLPRCDDAGVVVARKELTSWLS